MNELHISNVLISYNQLKKALAKNIVRRRTYTSLHRGHIQRNRLLDSYIIRHLLIGACVNSLANSISVEPVDEAVAEFRSVIENKKAGYSEIEQIAETITKTGRYQPVLDVLLDIGNRYSLNQSEAITYFLATEGHNAKKTEHARLIEDVIDRLYTLEIEPKSPDHVYRQVLLTDVNGASIGDIDLAVLSNSDVWHIIEAKTGKKKNTGRMRNRAKRCLRYQYNFLRDKLGILPELTCVYRTNGSNKFNWFRYEKPA